MFSKIILSVLFGVLSLGIVGFSDAYAANPDLFVSAENDEFGNYMSGPQIIEVVILDPDLNDTDEARGEPDVTVNGNALRMVQATDGNWYGYFADVTRAQIADSTSTVPGVGLDFGTFCSSTTNYLGIAVTETVGVAVPSIVSTGVDGTHPASTITATCDDGGTTSFNGTAMNVLRESKEVNPGNGGNIEVGQIGLLSNSAGIWPFIQLYDLSLGGNVVIDYNQGSGLQSTTLTYDTVEAFASVELDRETYPRNSQVHATVTDLWLNIDPTDEDSWTFQANPSNSATMYQMFDEDGLAQGDAVTGGAISINHVMDGLLCETNCILILDPDQQATGIDVVTIQDNGDTQITLSGDSESASSAKTSQISAGTYPITITETRTQSGIFTTFDDADISTLRTTTDAQRHTTATFEYNEDGYSIVTAFNIGTIDIQPLDDEWNSGEQIPVVLIDGDANKNTKHDDDFNFFNPDVELIPSLQIGTPFTLESLSDVKLSNHDLTLLDVQRFSQRAMLDSDLNIISIQDGDSLILTTDDTFEDLYKSINNPSDNFKGFNYFHYDLRSIQKSVTGGSIVSFDIDITDGIKTSRLASNVNSFHDNLIDVSFALGDDLFSMDDSLPVKIIFTFDVVTGNPIVDGIVLPTEVPPTIPINTVLPIASDFFSFGLINDGANNSERVSNILIRLELEESGDNTSIFEGYLEYTMLNQLTAQDSQTYAGLSIIDNESSFVVPLGMTDEDSPRVNYNDLDIDGIVTQIADQEEAPSHSGVVSFDRNSYKIGDTVIVTLNDSDLNLSPLVADIYAVVNPTSFPTDPARDTVGEDGLGQYTTLSLGAFGRILDITFDNIPWTSGETLNGGLCNISGIPHDGLSASGFTLAETDDDSNIFVGTFEVPATFCNSITGLIESTNGKDIGVNYVDFADASSNIVQVGDSTGVRASTGSVSLDRVEYPIPWGQIDDFDDPVGEQVTPAGSNPDETRSLLPLHATAILDGDLDSDDETVANGDLIIHVRVSDEDFNLSDSSEDIMATDNVGSTVGPVKISISRDSEEIILGYAGGSTPNLNGVLDVNADASGIDLDDILQIGGIHEIAPAAGIFELDFVVRYSDGPSSILCPDSDSYLGTDGITRNIDPLIRFDALPNPDETFCILGGDTLTVEYTDAADASGDLNIVTDSAVFDLRNGVLQSDKSVYRIGSDMILTLIDSDLNLDYDHAEIYDLDLIEWDSDAATVTLGDAWGEIVAFNPEPLHFRETGDRSGIFQVVIEIPESLQGDVLERNEEIVLEYSDWSSEFGHYVGDQQHDATVTIFTSNFGATVELDQKTYSWTDKVFITIVAPDHNFNSNVVDTIGETSHDPIKISTRGFDLDNYELVETDVDTGIFTGEVILTGFCHDADGDPATGPVLGDCPVGDDTNPVTSGIGPVDGLLETSSDDGLVVSFEFSEDETVVGSALIMWNVGTVEWDQHSYDLFDTSTITLVDPDMNLNPESFDVFSVHVWSDTDLDGIDIPLTETAFDSGVFRNELDFTLDESEPGSDLQVSELDVIYVKYSDHTLPDPYTTQDDLDVIASSIVNSNPTIHRISFDNTQIVDVFGNVLDDVLLNQQVLVSSDLVNLTPVSQPFTYALFVNDENNVPILSEFWIVGSLVAGQSFSPSLFWTPTESGIHILRAELWNNSDDREFLGDPIELIVDVIGPEPVFCDDSTIDELIVSGDYNVIDNRDGPSSTLKGTKNADLILAGDFGDTVKAGKGDDCVIGGIGSDDIRGAKGNDQIFGVDGNDRLIGGKGIDLIFGGNGNDELRGGAGNDQIFGENGDDKLKGGKDNDTLSCGVGVDIANGGKGTDTATIDCETIKKSLDYLEKFLNSFILHQSHNHLHHNIR